MEGEGFEMGSDEVSPGPLESGDSSLSEERETRVGVQSEVWDELTTMNVCKGDGC